MCKNQVLFITYFKESLASNFPPLFESTTSADDVTSIQNQNINKYIHM